MKSFRKISAIFFLVIYTGSTLSAIAGCCCFGEDKCLSGMHSQVEIAPDVDMSCHMAEEMPMDCDMAKDSQMDSDVQMNYAADSASSSYENACQCGNHETDTDSKVALNADFSVKLLDGIHTEAPNGGVSLFSIVIDVTKSPLSSEKLPKTDRPLYLIDSSFLI